jgi:hypothetical protein
MMLGIQGDLNGSLTFALRASLSLRALRYCNVSDTSSASCDYIYLHASLNHLILGYQS